MGHGPRMGRRLDPNRLITVLGVAVVLLGALSVYALTQGAPEAPPQRRSLDQLRETIGPDVEIRYVQAGPPGVICGYAASRGGANDTAFISRPNRLLLSTDPLKTEFETMMDEVCPGFIRPLPAAQ